MDVEESNSIEFNIVIQKYVLIIVRRPGGVSMHPPHSRLRPFFSDAQTYIPSNFRCYQKKSWWFWEILMNFEEKVLINQEYTRVTSFL